MIPQPRGGHGSGYDSSWQDPPLSHSARPRATDFHGSCHILVRNRYAFATFPLYGAGTGCVRFFERTRQTPFLLHAVSCNPDPVPTSTMTPRKASLITHVYGGQEL